MITYVGMDLTRYIAVRVADGTYDIAFMVRTYGIDAIRAEIGPYDLESKVSPEMMEHLKKIDACKHRGAK